VGKPNFTRAKTSAVMKLAQSCIAIAKARAVAALRGECLNGHQDVFKGLRDRIPPKQLALNREQEKETISATVEQSRRFFDEFAAQEDSESEFVRIMHLLPE
jgi:hypothetical protein